MIDAVVAIVIDFSRLINAISVNIGERPLVLDGVGDKTFREVDNLAHLTILEQCGVALAIHLLHLPSHWWQHEYILTCQGVGLYNHALALHLYSGLMTTSSRMIERNVTLRNTRVQVVIDQP